MVLSTTVRNTIVGGYGFFFDGVQSTILYPALPFFVQRIGASTPGEISLYVGAIVSAYYVGQSFSGAVWGRMSEGSLKRSILLLVLSFITSVVCLICFGLSTGIEQAVLSRLASGLLNGVIPVTKKYIVQAVPESFIVKAFAALMFHYNVGAIIGPIIGGFLYDPTTKYSALSSVELLKTYPILLPCAVAALFAVGGSVVSPLFHNEPVFDEPVEMVDKQVVIMEADEMVFKEKKGNVKSSRSEFHVPRRLSSEFRPEKYSGGEMLSAILPHEDVTKALADPGLPTDSTASICSTIPSPSLTDVTDESQTRPGLLSRVQVVHADDDDIISEELYPPAVGCAVDPVDPLPSEDTLSDIKCAHVDEEMQNQSRVAPKRSFLSKTIICLISTMSIVSLVHIVFDAIVPMIMAMTRKEGGLGMDSEKTAILQSFGALAGMTGQFTVYFPMMKRWGAVTSSRVGMFFLIPLFAAFPFVVMSSQITILMWVLLLALYCVRAVSVILTYPCINIMVGKASPPELRGRATGVTHSTASAMLAVGPFGGSAFFTLLLGSGLSSFVRNSMFCLLFVVISAVGVGCAFMISQVYWFVDENDGNDIVDDHGGNAMKKISGDVLLARQDMLINHDDEANSAAVDVEEEVKEESRNDENQMVEVLQSSPNDIVESSS
eukprot:TRINITY_DN38466_c0_g1_i1.p1 TRINITY_DN38466_c0_g1~~TRINITY_DN38466_c0_g1_i1.p1  ORF type:complete len:663 (+),score=180.46 TRINITY_DN38466_c0_g1_i1:119-2107(+)